MAFQPRVGEELTIGGISYTIGEHPMAPGIPYGQEGRQGTVYQLIPKIETSSGWKAIKVFRSNFRDPKMVYLSEQLEKYADMPGLLVCDRAVLTPQQNGELLSGHRDLMYAVVMPWIEGPTWMDLILEKRELSKRESLLLARSLAKVLSGMEQRGLAHCDLSGSNIILPRMVKNSIEDGFSYVELVDVEQMYAPQIDRPDVLLGASPGYGAYQSHQTGQWSHYADRFAGAVLIAEMLGWSDPNVRDKAWGESYFMPEEMQQNCDRYTALIDSIRVHWGEEVARMTEITWESKELNQCPTFGEWLLELMELDEQKTEHSEDKRTEEEPVPAPIIALPIEKTPFTVQLESVAQFYKQVEQGKDLERLGRLEAALDVYRSVQKYLPINHPLAQDLVMVIHELEARIEARRLLELESIPQNEETEVNKGRRRRQLVTAALAVALVFGGGGFVWSQMEAKKAEQTAKAQEEAKKKAELEAQLKADQLAREQAEAEAKMKAELEAKQQAEAEAKQKAELAAKQQAQLAAKKQAELAAKLKAEEEAKQKAALDAKRQWERARAAKEAAAKEAALREQALKRQEALKQEALRKQALQREQLKKQALASGANLIPKQQNGLWGYVKNSQSGVSEVAIQYAYDFATPFSEGLAVVKKHGKFGYINVTGKVVIPIQYDWASPFNNGKAAVKKDGKNLQINKNGEVIK